MNKMPCDWVKQTLKSGSDLYLRTAGECCDDIVAAAAAVLETLRDGGKVLLCGNGGSAADAQHIATEMTVKMCKVREPMAAVALTTNPSLLTAQANDLGFDTVFSRQVTSLGSPGDILIAISTSGNSPNVLEAVKAARENNMKTVGLIGCGGGKLAPLCDIAVVVPSDEIQRIQETHIAIAHMICEHAETGLYGE
jgi:D-sedoheptulose 7-phosphate isomerase